MLDILGDYLSLRNYPFQRLDGTVPAATRRIAIDHFNAPDSPDYVFLLSTRAGGLGINLMTADTVILFDSDWNPQADLQAMARAHRIGQKSHVMVYRLVSKDTIEEDVLERARKKMILEYAIISLGVTDQSISKKKDHLTGEELSNLLKFGASKMFQASDNQRKLEEMNLDDMLEHAEDHDTTATIGGSNLGGEDFLKQFEVTDYKMDNTSWDDIIPQPELTRIKDEEKRLQDEAFLQEQIRLNSKRVVASRQILGTTEGASSPILAQIASKKSAPNHKNVKNPKQPLSERELRNLYRALLRYGDLERRWSEIAQEAHLQDRDQTLIRGIADQMYAESQKAFSSTTTSNDTTKGTAINRRKAILFDFKGVKNINAETLLQRREDLEILAHEIGDDNEYQMNFRIAAPVKAVHLWSCSWGAKDDAMLLVGIHRHGYGAWVAIRDDPDLQLSEKFFLDENRVDRKEGRTKEETTVSKVPGAVHLVRRADYLIGFIKDLRHAVKGTTNDDKIISKLKRPTKVTKASQSPTPNQVFKKHKPENIESPAMSRTQSNDSQLKALDSGIANGGGVIGEVKMNPTECKVSMDHLLSDF